VTERRFDHALGAGPAVLREESFSSDPPLTPMRIGIASLGDVDDFLDEPLAPIFPGFSRSPFHPLSSAMSASL